MADLLIHLVCGWGISKYFSTRKMKKKLTQNEEIAAENRIEKFSAPISAVVPDADVIDEVTGKELIGLDHGDLHSPEFGLLVSASAGLANGLKYKKDDLDLKSGFKAGALRAGFGYASHILLDYLTNWIGFKPFKPSFSEFGPKLNEYISQIGPNAETVGYALLSTITIFSAYYFHRQEKKGDSID